ncbi:dsDNA nuclease domain-containing protein [Anaerotruncus colihominis]|uniref:dsDNA nuclease domain-containing protein n=1 Tax=Anaerotruncus colihominis TaxID=169435 RepID=UPI00243318F4|nr:dsDNA nuclease domain-containing protein [Anaerotruncus colihominis]
MSKVLTTEQREQAGSDSYNRFEYQVHWIVCHIIGKLQEDAECIIFCEFHDDMAEFSPNNQQYQFFQIKTKEDSSDWTIAEMSKKEKKKAGGYKKSFLGFIFYNYLVFGVECSHCHFVSNNDFDNEILLWQSYIEDGKRLQTENIALYTKIKDRIREEFSDDMPSNFDSVFDDFIQRTFVHKSELQLTTYETQTMGKFFNHLADKNIPSNTAHLIFQQLLNDVRKKSKEKIKIPISMKKANDKKADSNQSK